MNRGMERGTRDLVVPGENFTGEVEDILSRVEVGESESMGVDRLKQVTKQDESRSHNLDIGGKQRRKRVRIVASMHSKSEDRNGYAHESSSTRHTESHR